MTTSQRRGLVRRIAVCAVTAAALVPAITGNAAAVEPLDPSYYTYSLTTPITLSTTNSAHDPSNVSAVAVDDSTHMVFLLSADGATVTLVNGSTYAVVATIAAGSGRGRIAVDPVTHTAYVTHDKGAARGTVSVIDEATRSVTATIQVGVSPYGVAVDPGKHTVYVTNQGADRTAAGTVSVIDTATRSVTHTIGVGKLPANLVVDTTTHTVYVANDGDGYGPDSVGATISVIDGTTNSVTHSILVGYFPTSMSVDPGLHSLYVGDNTYGDAGTVQVIDTRTNSLIDDRTLTDPIATGIPADPVTHTVYVVDSQYGTAVYEGSDGGRLDSSARLSDSRDPGSSDAALDAATHKVFIANSFDDTVSVITQQPPAPPRPDRTSVGFQSRPVRALSPSPVSTSGPRELLVAFVQADGPADGIQQVTSMTGAGLTWTRATAVNARGQGATEIWRAFALDKVTNAKVTARLARAADAAVTVKSYTGAADVVGTTGGAAAIHGPSARVDVTTRSGSSLIVAGGLDWSSPNRPSPAAGQSIRNYSADRRVDDHYWVQTIDAPTGYPGDSRSVRATVPASSRWSIAVAEVIPPAAINTQP